MQLGEGEISVPRRRAWKAGDNTCGQRSSPALCALGILCVLYVASRPDFQHLRLLVVRKSRCGDKSSDHMVVRSFELFRENVCSIHTGDIIFASCQSGPAVIACLCLSSDRLDFVHRLSCSRQHDQSSVFDL